MPAPQTEVVAQPTAQKGMAVAKPTTKSKQPEPKEPLRLRGGIGPCCAMIDACLCCCALEDICCCGLADLC